MRFTKEQYEKAIEALKDGMTQLEPNGDNCHICHDSGHAAFECGWNPLVAVVICKDIATHSEKLHETLHYLAGFDRYMGEQVGPAAVRGAPQVDCNNEIGDDQL